MKALNAEPAIVVSERTPTPKSSLARQRFDRRESGPLFLADWMDVLFIHYEVDRARLQSSVPFKLDSPDGRARVSLVAFSMRRLRPAVGGALTAIPFRIVGETRFLNVRTYVRHDNEPGIFFMKEFMSSRLSAPLRPLTYGLPYHLARLDYDCRAGEFAFNGRIRRKEGHERRLRFTARINKTADALDYRGDDERRKVTEFLTEQYTAYTCRRGRHRLFRIWHDPWSLRPAEVSLEDHDLLETTGDWLEDARFIGAQYSPGARNVWMGPPHAVTSSAAIRSRRHRHAAFLELP